MKDKQDINWGLLIVFFIIVSNVVMFYLINSNNLKISWIYELLPFDHNSYEFGLSDILFDLLVLNFEIFVSIVILILTFLGLMELLKLGAYCAAKADEGFNKNEKTKKTRKKIQTKTKKERPYTGSNK